VGTKEDIAKVGAGLNATLTTSNVSTRFVAAHGDPVIEQVVSSAKAGIGPDNRPYPPYSESYRKSLGLDTEGYSHTLVRRAYKGLKSPELKKYKISRLLGAGNKAWLTLTGAMLARGNWAWRIEGGQLWLVWTAPDEQVGAYAEAHNFGSPKMPQREFVHVESAGSTKALEDGIEASINELVDEFNSAT